MNLPRTFPNFLDCSPKKTNSKCRISIYTSHIDMQYPKSCLVQDGYLVMLVYCNKLSNSKYFENSVNYYQYICGAVSFLLLQQKS